MAKLSISGKAGFNAGDRFSHLVKISDIKIDPEISKIFSQSDRIRNEIRTKIEKLGFDKSQPVVLWKGKNILIDGHTRLEAALESKLDEVPAVEMEFASYEEAILYTFERQAIRRNLTGADILRAAQMMIKGPKAKNGAGRQAELLAKRIGVCPATIYAARKVLAEASKEELKAIQKGEKTIPAVYQRITAKPEIDFTVTDAQGLPKHVRFLKGAVVLLAEAHELTAVKLLITHFLKKREKEGFYKILPDSCREEVFEAVHPARKEGKR
jgi:ParB family chromosome partitioning protein